ncbi:hypothetical protein BU24DRAFT_456834 [Aaosphaeria arxii CBS 175.79]|uniref:Uncharacterized protein n=1 Tax=Aaosphaeria arxii CBS 175.79 TaxID=1450172 RepID=A0A6A5Y665_9PLEO|nr:uncharacterized protein BU24DRAFT_456834 [Aaosphaeria arxii CBS 175.79]KAF2020799.1 hypothetical protein BU24DRAFT_456834 [Aaosphaeria arxii CBS 175.79]
MVRATSSTCRGRTAANSDRPGRQRHDRERQRRYLNDLISGRRNLVDRVVAGTEAHGQVDRRNDNNNNTSGEIVHAVTHPGAGPRHRIANEVPAHHQNHQNHQRQVNIVPDVVRQRARELRRDEYIDVPNRVPQPRANSPFNVPDRLLRLLAAPVREVAQDNTREANVASDNNDLLAMLRGRVRPGSPAGGRDVQTTGNRNLNINPNPNPNRDNVNSDTPNPNRAGPIALLNTVVPRNVGARRVGARDAPRPAAPRARAVTEEDRINRLVRNPRLRRLLAGRPVQRKPSRVVDMQLTMNRRGGPGY